MGGIRYVTGFPDRPPVRIGVSLGDALAAQQAVLGAQMALRAAERDGVGQVVDVSIAEAAFALTEAMLTEYAHAGVVRERVGNSFQKAAPSNVYRTGDGRWLAVGGNGENVFRRLAAAMGQPELVEDARFHDNRARVAHAQELDEIVGTWVASRTLAQAQEALDAAAVPAGPVMSIADIADDPQYLSRGMIAQVPDARMLDGVAVMPGIIPRLTETPGRIARAGGALGADNASVYRDLLGLTDDDVARLEAEGVI
jgi:crotonobetainyl-CoA:carnitine CoA-transferase CaiB-like acyl-CoA transferase